MEQAGVRAASRLTLMREYLPVLRSLLAGEEVAVSGRYVTLDQVRLDWPPQTAPPVYSAGQGPKTLALTGEVADGTILVAGLTPAEVSGQVRRVRDAHAAAARWVVTCNVVHAARAVLVNNLAPSLRMRTPCAPVTVPAMSIATSAISSTRIGISAPARLAIAAIMVALLLVVGVMSMTPVHMSHGGAGLRVVGIVISAHVAGMYALSPLAGGSPTGWAGPRCSGSAPHS